MQGPRRDRNVAFAKDESVDRIRDALGACSIRRVSWRGFVLCQECKIVVYKFCTNFVQPYIVVRRRASSGYAVIAYKTKTR